MAKVIFNEQEHSYTNNENNRRYTSATQLISKFKQPFDKVAVAKAYAAKNGRTPEYWIEQWANISAKACIKGTAFHKKKEDAILSNSAIIKEDSSVSNVHDNNAIRDLPSFDFKELPNGIHVEALVHIHEFEIAGQIDFLEIEDNYFDIDDHKTNKKIDKTSFRHPKTGYKRMKFPLSHLMDCNYVHYSLQISLYAFMVEQLTGKKPRSLPFHHYPPNPENPDEVLEEGIRYDVPYLKNEVLNMLAVATGKQVSQYK